MKILVLFSIYFIFSNLVYAKQICSIESNFPGKEYIEKKILNNSKYFSFSKGLMTLNFNFNKNFMNVQKINYLDDSKKSFYEINLNCDEFLYCGGERKYKTNNVMTKKEIRIRPSQKDNDYFIGKRRVLKTQKNKKGFNFLFIDFFDGTKDIGVKVRCTNE